MQSQNFYPLIIVISIVNCFINPQEWDRKAIEAKEKYTILLKEFEANGGDKNASPAGKKRKAVKKAAPKKIKKRGGDSDDDEEEEESD